MCRITVGMTAIALLFACLPASAQDCTLEIRDQAVTDHNLHVTGTVSAGVNRGFFQNQQNQENELRVLVEWIKPGGTFRLLPAMMVIGRGPAIAESRFLTPEEQTGVNAESVEIWSRKLEKPEHLFAQDHDYVWEFEGNVEITGAVKYRVVGELSHRWTDENGELRWIFDHRTVESDIGQPGLVGGEQGHDQTAQTPGVPPAQQPTGQQATGEQPPAGSTGGSIGQWAALVRQYYESGGQQPPPDSSEMAQARQMLANTNLTAQGQQQTIGQIIQTLHQNISGPGTHDIPAAAGVSDSIFNTRIEPLSEGLIRNLIQMHIQRITGASAPGS